MICSSCKVDKPEIAFVLVQGRRKGRICKLCKNIKQQNYRDRNNNIFTYRYEKSPKGYLMRTYRNMQSRVEGVSKNKAHLYRGLELLNREEFYEWSLSNKVFETLLKRYESSGYDMKLAPSIDRIDTSKGYTLDNIRWITHSENSRLGSMRTNEDK